MSSKSAAGKPGKPGGPPGGGAGPRSRMVSAARDLLMTDGYGAVLVPAVARTAGVPIQEAGRLFPSRGRLVLEALEFHWGEIRPFVEEVFSSGHPPVERLRRFFAGAGGFQAHHAGRLGCVVGCLLLRVGSSIPRDEVKIRRSVQAMVTELEGHFERTIREAQAEGTVRKGDASAKAWAVVHYFEGMLGIARIDGNLEAFDGALDRVLEFLGAEPAQAQ